MHTRINMPVELRDKIYTATLMVRVLNGEYVSPFVDMTPMNKLMAEHETRLDQLALPYAEFVENRAKPMGSIANDLHHFCTGMSTEAGETLSISKKAWIYDKPLDEAMLMHLIEELGDFRYYYQGALTMLGLSDEDIEVQNKIKLAIRFPEGQYSNERAQVRLDKPEENIKPAPGADRQFFGKPVAENSTPALPDSFTDELAERNSAFEKREANTIAAMHARVATTNEESSK